MDGWVIGTIVAAAVVVVVAGLARWAMVRRRHHRLHDRFGPEYDRVMDRAESRRDAEIDLRERVEQRREIELKPLAPAARQRYADEWQEVQTHFVDRPETAVDEADGLVSEVMAERGYPLDEDFERNASLLSVDHPQLVQNYRAAHVIADRNRSRRASTEELRRALLHYRSLFEELLVTEGQDASR